MLDFSRIIGFDWDRGNSPKIVEKHGLSTAEAEQVFQGERFMVVADSRHSDQEPRYQALGATFDGRSLQVTFTLRGEGTLIRVISARSMNRKERAIYGKQT